MPLIDNITDEIRQEAARILPDNAAIFETELTREDIIRLLYQEYLYWSDSESWTAPFSLGPVCNVLGKIAMNHKP